MLRTTLLAIAPVAALFILAGCADGSGPFSMRGDTIHAAQNIAGDHHRYGYRDGPRHFGPNNQPSGR